MNTIQQTGSTIEQGFLKFHEKHPKVYSMFKTYFDFLSNRKGWRRVSGKFIIEKIRAEVFTGSEHEEYKIDNSYTSFTSGCSSKITPNLQVILNFVNPKQMTLAQVLNNPLWKRHKIGNIYSMINRDGSESDGWKIAYYPLFGTYRNEQWIEFNEPRALIEHPIKNGTDFREVALRFLKPSR